MTTQTSSPEELRSRSRRLGLYGLVANWSDVEREPWLEKLLALEEAERQRRSLERRLQNARIGRFKPMADFDWKWPKVVDREAIDELFTFGFVQEGANAVLVGPNGIGKTMIVQNLAHQALLRGLTVRFTTASDMLSELAAQESDASLARRLHRYCRPQLLVIDEVGYLSYDARYADLLFEVVTRRYEQRSIVLTTNKSFSDWREVFPNAACVVTLVDRLVHRAEIIKIDAHSYRKKEAMERAAQRAQQRAARKGSRAKRQD
jgi:DNA replication protein DnaC